MAFNRYLAGRCEQVFLRARPDGGGLAVRCKRLAAHRPADGSWLCDECQRVEDENAAALRAARSAEKPKAA